jgi:hypothetical protein
MVVDLMADKKQQDRLLGPLTKEIKEFIDFKRQSGSLYQGFQRQNNLPFYVKVILKNACIACIQ